MSMDAPPSGKKKSLVRVGVRSWQQPQHCRHMCIRQVRVAAWPPGIHLSSILHVLWTYIQSKQAEDDMLHTVQQCGWVCSGMHGKCGWGREPQPVKAERLRSYMTSGAQACFRQATLHHACSHGMPSQAQFFLVLPTWQTAAHAEVHMQGQSAGSHEL